MTYHQRKKAKANRERARRGGLAKARNERARRAFLARVDPVRLGPPIARVVVILNEREVKEVVFYERDRIGDVKRKDKVLRRRLMEALRTTGPVVPTGKGVGL